MASTVTRDGGVAPSSASICALLGEVRVLGQNTPNKQPDDRSEPGVRDSAKAQDPTRVQDRAKGQSRDRDRDMGSALRSVYQKTVDESVPPDLLDLLGKLD